MILLLFFSFLFIYIYVLSINQKVIYFKNNMIFLLFLLIIFVLPGSIPDPFHGFMKWIRIRPNDTDPAGSGSGSTLHWKELREI